MGLRSASVIINTIDRADSLQKLLETLQYQWADDPFEVVVVTGPCKDHTLEMLETWQGRIKHLQCAEANLSMSRNIGIGAAAGEVVAFIDDDALPEPRWLAELLEPFSNPEVVATGGYVWDHTGANLQCRFNRSDRLGRSSFHADAPLDELCFPGAEQFPYVPGGNGAWRREQLCNVGAFDENYEYYLDEVDVAVRAIDAGWRLAQIPGAAIHHKFMSSSVRSNTRVLTNRYPVLKNKILFGFFNGRSHCSLDEIVEEAALFAAEHRSDAINHIDHARLGPGMLEAFDRDAERALVDGLEVGLAGARKLGSDTRDLDHPPGFLDFPLMPVEEDRRRYVFVSQAIPPDPIGGIGRYMLDTARGLAARGHDVRLITDGVSHDTIDLEEGVWIHRLVKPGATRTTPPRGLETIPERIWANAVRVDEEVERLHDEYPVDAVYAAVWDTEALAVQQRTDIPVVVALVTSLGLALESNPTWAQGEGFMRDFAEPMLRVERAYLSGADRFHAISQTIATEIQRNSGVAMDPDRLVTAGLGSKDPRDSGASSLSRADDGEVVNLLFVGRFEKRKGIDLLLEALAKLLPVHEHLHATLVGKSDLVGPGNGTWVDWFETEFPGGDWRARLTIAGEVSDERLGELYRDADLFVAPSRFESFGLIYVEAMSHGLPLVALAEGAATEVADVTSAMLVPESAKSLAEAIERLVLDPKLRASMGEAGRSRYENLFTEEVMVDRIGKLLAEVTTSDSVSP